MCDFTLCFNFFLHFSIRERLPQSLCEAADRQETVSALLLESALSDELHIPPGCFGTLQMLEAVVENMIYRTSTVRNTEHLEGTVHIFPLARGDHLSI